VDVNRHVVNTLRNGGLHIHEPGLRTLVQAAIGSGNLILREEPELSDAFIIAVPTPYGKDKRADLRDVVSAAESVAKYLRPGNLVVLESTSPPRTTMDVVAPILENSGLMAGIDFHLAYSPERVLPGQIIRELVENARVLGGVDDDSAKAGRDLYSIFTLGEIILTNATTAEIVKLMENTYRDVNIGIANEFSKLADRFGIDVWKAIEIANNHPRVQILNPGLGVGGHCIGVDPWFLVEAAPEITPLIQSARQVNDAQPKFIFDLFIRALGVTSHQALENKNVTVLGLAYKPDVDDIRESPAIEVTRLLVEAGAQVRAYDPYVTKIEIPGVQVCASLESALEEAQIIVLLVAHTTLKELDPKKMADLTQAQIAIDAVNGWHLDRWTMAGFNFYRLGTPIS
jgi:UDP-N-acetyl-D-mannosaminuronic acid dehydrogenase